MKPLSRFVAAASLVCAALLAGCADTGGRLLQDAHIVYAIPAGWVVEDFPDHRGVFTYAMPRPNEVEASIGIELAEKEDLREPDEIMNDFVAKSEDEGQDQTRTRINQSMDSTKGGLAFGRVDYRQSRIGGDYLDSVYVIPIHSTRRLYVYTSMHEIWRAKYAEAIDTFLNSISVVR